MVEMVYQAAGFFLFLFVVTFILLMIRIEQCKKLKKKIKRLEKKLK